ncbi:MAG TPA: nucleotide sugar dehydrogenase [Rhizomicrobium sp.]|jgi:UDP-N-acetyl-D-glucosamine dehydrogenase|nr:nucleotide sugar dehydrogenase [Rhizomicrobium sp.]
MAKFEDKLGDKTVRVGVIGLGYVGLPLIHVFWQAGLNTVGFDVDPAKIQRLAQGETYIKHFASDHVRAMNASGRFTATADFAQLANVDAVLICVPTPLRGNREPDLTFVVATTEMIAKHLHGDMLVVLESTTYPGTTTEVVQPILETSGLKVGSDVLLAFSPEREDPGSGYETRKIPKIVGGVDDRSGSAAEALYALAFAEVHRVRDTQTAEAVKITENIFRAVNIALVNELKVAYTRMGINVWDVIDAAKTKPFGFMPFYPGPGLGGHCIPIDPFYLSWRARQFNVKTDFIELAGEVNQAMPQLVVDTLTAALQTHDGKPLREANVLVMGVAYKKNVDDLRESPALRIMEIIKEQGGSIAYHDPYIPEILPTREHANLQGMRSVTFDEPTVSGFDAVLITTDHSNVDYASLVKWSRLVIDTRNATKNVHRGGARVIAA